MPRPCYPHTPTLLQYLSYSLFPHPPNANTCSAEEVARFTALAREEGILAKIQASIAPKIFGAQDIKKAVACLLFGGCRKVGGHPWW